MDIFLLYRKLLPAISCCEALRVWTEETQQNIPQGTKYYNALSDLAINCRVLTNLADEKLLTPLGFTIDTPTPISSTTSLSTTRVVVKVAAKLAKDQPEFVIALACVESSIQLVIDLLKEQP